jgi:hypothetical protein
MTCSPHSITLDPVEADAADMIMAALGDLAPVERTRVVRATEVLLGFELDAPGARQERPRPPPKPSIRTLVKQAEQATGKAVTAITLADGTKLELGESTPTDAASPWLNDLRVAKR